MKKDLNKEVSEIWTKYGERINQKFGFPNHIIESEPLLNIINNPSNSKKKEFIEYCENQIQILNDLE